MAGGGIRNQGMISMANMSNLTSLSSTSSLLFNYHQYKKCHSASIPIYLSEAGFLKMITTSSSGGSDSQPCPLEIFLASYHLKKLLIKAFQSDTNTVSHFFSRFYIIFWNSNFMISFKFQLKNAENNMYKTLHVDFQISNEISANYTAFSITFTPNNNDVPVERLQTYLTSKILTPPYKSPSVISFFNMVSCPELKMLKEFIQLLDYELVCDIIKNKPT